MKAPAFQFYPADFLADGNTALMTAEEIGIYWLLICYCWQKGEIPIALDDLAIYAKTPLERFSEMWNRRIKKCFIERETGFVHPHLEAQKEKHAAISSKRSMSGAKGGRPKANALFKESKTKAKESSSISSSSSKEETLPPPVPTQAGQQEKPKRASKPKPTAIVIPDELDVPEFHDLWNRWVKHRIEKKAPITPSIADAQFRQFIEWGKDRTTAAVNHTIFMGWQGLREPKPGDACYVDLGSQEKEDEGPDRDEVIARHGGMEGWLKFCEGEG